jgi:uncharacterized protein
VFGDARSHEPSRLLDSGLSAYMLHAYNYMAIGITGFAALGAFMLSVPGDPGTAATAAWMAR